MQSRANMPNIKRDLVQLYYYDINSLQIVFAYSILKSFDQFVAIDEVSIYI